MNPAQIINFTNYRRTIVLYEHGMLLIREIRVQKF